MKRMKLWLCCGLLLTLLSGCGDEAKTPDALGQSPDQNISGENQENGDDVENDDSSEIYVPEDYYEDIPEHWQSTDSQGILWHVPNAGVEESEPYSIFEIGDVAYICRHKYDDKFSIVKMDLSNEKVLQETELSLSGAQVQALENVIVFYNAEGKIVVLDADLQIKGTFFTRAIRGEWYFGNDGTVLYDFREDGTMAKVDLLRGNRETLLKNMEDWHTIGANENYVNFYYTDSTEQKTKQISLNLQTGQLDEIPFKEEVAYLYRKDNIWLGRSHLVEERHMICRSNGEMYEIVSEKYTDTMDVKKIYLMDSQNLILTIAENGTKMMLHDYNGKFISECQMPEGYCVVFDVYNRDENCFIWDDVYGGYYFLGYEAAEDGVYYYGEYGGMEDHLAQNIYFWDIDADVPAKDLQLKAYDAQNPSQITVSTSLYERAEQISEKYGVDIKIADKANSKFEIYYYLHGNAAMEEELILAGLDVLESVLQEKGTNYFEDKILTPMRERVEIHMLEDLVVVSGMQEGGMDKINKDKVDYHFCSHEKTMYIYIDVETVTTEVFEEVFSRFE